MSLKGHKLVNPSLAKSISAKVSNLTIKPIRFWKPNGFTMISPIYRDSIPVRLFLTKIKGINTCLLNITSTQDWYYVYYRFSDEVYNDTTLWGQIVGNTIVVNVVKFQGSNDLSKSLMEFDQILYNKYVEDEDLERLKIKIAPTSRYENQINLDHNVIGRYYINNSYERLHFKSQVEQTYNH